MNFTKDGENAPLFTCNGEKMAYDVTMHCTDCTSYNHGAGRKSCLLCPQYRDIVRRSGRRATISIDVIPDIILEAVPDESGITLEQAIRRLPLELSVPLMMHHVLGAPLREIAKYLNISTTTGTRKINLAIDIIKEMHVIE